jgi:hypothetical protein
MNKGYVVFLFILCLSVLPANAVIDHTSTINAISVESFPLTGDITTDIIIRVRGIPYDGLIDTYALNTNIPKLYIIYDGKIIVNGQNAPTYTLDSGHTGYSMNWDTKIKAPNEYPYSESGVHIITARVEAGDSTIATDTCTFSIINYVSPPSFWSNLPPEFIERIRGYQGQQGIQGIQGIRGIDGADGIDGKDAPTNLIYLGLVVSVISLVMSLLINMNIKKLRNELIIKQRKKE